MASPRKRRTIHDDTDTDSDHEANSPPTKRQRRVVLDDDGHYDKSTSSNKDETAPLAPLNASQNLSSPPSSSSPLPTLPTEVLLNILEQTSGAHLLEHRQWNKAYSNAIPTRIFYHHIQQAEVIGYLGPRKPSYGLIAGNDSYEMMELLSLEEYWKIAYVRCRFESLDPCKDGQAKWDPVGATFRPDPAWSDLFRHIGGSMEGSSWRAHTFDCLDLNTQPAHHGQLRWIVKVGDAALDWGIKDKFLKETDVIPMLDEKDGSLVVRVTNWKNMLWNFFREEKALSEMLQETRFSQFTYGHLEDCLRQMRRTRLHADLDCRVSKDRHLARKIGKMKPLFAKDRYFKLSADFGGVEGIENDYVNTIMMLRREAVLTGRGKEALFQLVRDKAELRQEMRKFDDTYKQWQANILNMPKRSYEHSSSSSSSSSDSEEEDSDGVNPLAWSDEKVAKERKALSYWRDNQKMIRAMSTFFHSTNAAMDKSADAFGEYES
ncbi:hypothetical protein CC80DRAFT_280807 [Byssothecium circinans]|uniref:F-box domain-containing protein n=1 Tax=Byssothecium circinans TaxID=147558 RepID=A0A6A5TBK2_9PLEO|nr:hypothetical protein CC80DRAFT_280807 [Byssothecium circinans]